ncbi:effector binding domain-containing protein [Gorillibacterium sp. CAU 1737]|uniref:effector binding domain-containing protein n=1 Tax=Gorillibacterium sp. CAU 1737 TaxID=3140362 RepID=UPI003260BF94
MELQTISQVSKGYDISPRMLRYYEQVGLIQSIRKKDNAYRLYDEAALKRVQQIVILRKLQIPVKQICVIMNSLDAVTVIDIFKKNISELDSELTALSTIRKILAEFIRELEHAADLHLKLDFLGDDSIAHLAGSLSLIQRNVKESMTLNDLNKATEVLNKLKDVRVVYLPPMTVASAYFSGEKAEEKAWQAITDFVKKSDLVRHKPDLRLFKIDYSNATGTSFGYEIWVSIPDEWVLPDPLVKKKFHGGQYAAYVLGDHGYEVLGLQDWVNESHNYQVDYEGNLARCEPPMNEIDSFGGMWLDLEEVLNFYNFQNPGFEIQIDYLTPIKPYVPSEDIPVEIPGSKEKCGYHASIVTKNKFKILGFTKIMTQDNNPEEFENELKTDGRLAILNKYRKCGAPILCFGSMDMDSQIRGGWRRSFCLMESDITDLQAFMKHDLYIRTIDTAKWLILEHTRGEAFDSHRIGMKLGYTWNGAISGEFEVSPDGKIGKPDPKVEAEMNSIVSCWYPVK